ncbi:hypothetical protein A4R43_28855 [Amycolatopsis albispora]|uniref:Ricin B lectin domain-containing protein n=2 Tax=Amycolatopsis albispora TaxID=1804986 RepID=A0A344LD72_9PSEU|nr:hypothetical protein A4R43_28855 [Amycolatopsis albispora]
MRQVRIRTGHSYRALERRAEQAGLVLPSSTISAALARDKLPRAELVDAFLKAAGADEETVERWLAVRADLASGVEVTPEDPRPPRRRLGYALVALAALAVIAVVVAVMTVGGEPESPPMAQPAPAELRQAPDKQRIRVVHTGMCLGEGKELFTGSGRDVIGQHPCETATPELSLVWFPNNTAQIQLHHPDKGLGCLAVDGVSSEMLLAGRMCEDGREDQLFQFEPVDGGHRMRSVAAGRWCIGVYRASAEPGVQLIQGPCDGGRHQVFDIDGA